jgi:hypothetical protein
MPMVSNQPAKQPITFDAQGTGQSPGSPGNNLSWTHTVAGNAIIVCLMQIYTAQTWTVKIGTTSIPQIGSLKATTSSQVSSNPIYLYMFGLMNPPIGSGLTVNIQASSSCYLLANSFSYKNVKSIGSPATTTSTTGTSLSQTVSSAPGHQIVQAFTVGSGTISTALSAYNKNSRSTQTGYIATVFGDAAGASSVNFTATANYDYYGWGGMAVDLST